MNRYAAGAIAGLVATIVLSALMLLKSSLGMLPQFNAVAMLAGVASQYAGLPATPIVGWVLHLLIGTLLWGLLFAWLAPWIAVAALVLHIIFGLVLGATYGALMQRASGQAATAH